MLLDKQQTRFQRPFYEPPKGSALVLPPRPLGTLSSLRKRPYDTMDAYSGYREPTAARSPQERPAWSGRDDNYRANDRADNPRTDSFYRGRSPGMSIFEIFVLIWKAWGCDPRYMRLQG